MCADKRLNEILEERFGFDGFRPNQEEVCGAVVDGNDVLLVMPTGSGKSLCYQLPGLALEGTTLVISPLIALIEDQVAKLQEIGCVAERIHSGRSRGDSNRVCRRYVDGELDFLFIAPERLSVPGFPEFLARRKPSLIAVDEAHCISHWGHDFRPDYRLLGERLPVLKPAPVIALTATATTRVQDDIVSGLDMGRGKRFIRGFWRDNLAVEARDCTKSVRPELILDLLKPDDARPAIVYVPTRKEAEQLAGTLSDRYSAVPYHAGLEPEVRAAAQTGFMEGGADVVVATIAFGMGIDKPNIRSVFHTALPDSIEVYYQEIGRAGRDGEPARVCLLYGWADRKLLEFLHSKSYPPPFFLSQVLSKLPERWTRRDDITFVSSWSEEDIDAALKQLYNHGAIEWTPDDRLRMTGVKDWAQTYREQRTHRLNQIEDVLGFARSAGCRMNLLVSHFSRGEAGHTRCGVCDNCAPEEARSRTFREPTRHEVTWMDEILDRLRQRDGVSVGRLHKTMFPSDKVSREHFDALLDGLERGGLVRHDEDAFEKEGRVITFRRVFLTGLSRDQSDARDEELMIDAAMAYRTVAVKPTRKKRGKASPEVLAQQLETALPPHHDQGDAQRALPCYEALQAWRTRRARRDRVPPFVVAANSTLRRVAAAQPTTEEELLSIKGIGPRMTEKYGEEILEAVRSIVDS